jgi:hypothetical protein
MINFATTGYIMSDRIEFAVSQIAVRSAEWIVAVTGAKALGLAAKR